MFRRWVAYDRANVSALSEKLTHLVESNRLQKAALENFLKQMAELVSFTQERKRELELRLAGKKLP
jgi:hypothetical protein